MKSVSAELPRLLGNGVGAGRKWRLHARLGRCARGAAAGGRAVCGAPAAAAVWRQLRLLLVLAGSGGRRGRGGGRGSYRADWGDCRAGRQPPGAGLSCRPCIQGPHRSRCGRQSIVPLPPWSGTGLPLLLLRGRGAGRQAAPLRRLRGRLPAEARAPAANRRRARASCRLQHLAVPCVSSEGICLHLHSTPKTPSRGMHVMAELPGFVHLWLHGARSGADDRAFQMTWSSHAVSASKCK